MADRPRSVLFAINSPFSTRDYVSEPLFENLVETVRAHGLVPVFSSYESAIADFVNENGAEFEPLALRGDGFVRKQLWKVKNSVLHRAVRYRHNEVNQFAHQERFKRITSAWGRSEHAAIRPHDIWPRYLGFPFPGNRRLLRLLTSAMGSGVFNHSKAIQRTFWERRPVLLLTAMVQQPISFSYIHHARKTGVPAVGIVGSWDHLTKEGPIPQPVKECWVWNESMRQEAMAYHGMEPERVQVLGASQFDKYRVPATEADVQALCEKFGISGNRQLITFAGNTNPRGVGEPSVVDHLAKRISSGELGLDKEAVIVVRSHPYDTEFEERFGGLQAHENVRLWQATQVKRSPVEEIREDARLLRALLGRSEMLIGGQGTPALDAACADIPAINVAFDGTEEIPEELGVRYRYEVDHYRKLLALDGTTVVESFDELDAAVRASVEDPAAKAEGRRRIREEFAGMTSSKSASERITERLDQILTELDDRKATTQAE